MAIKYLRRLKKKEFDKRNGKNINKYIVPAYLKKIYIFLL